MSTEEMNEQVEDNRPSVLAGPEEDEFETPQARGLSTRDEKMAALVKGRHKEINESLESMGLKPVEFGKKDEPKEEEEEVEVKAEEQESRTAEAPQKVELPPLSSDEVEVTLADGNVVRVPVNSIKTKVKVDGEEQELSLDKVRSGYQKDQVASKRLEMAAQKLKEIEARQQQVKPPSQDVAKPTVDVLEEARKIREALYSDDADQADAAIAKLLLSANKPTQSVQPQEIVNQVLRETEGRNAAEWFKSEYSDIANDPNLMKIADQLTDKLIAENPNRKFQEVFKEAGDGVRDWLKAVQPKQEVKIDLQSRVEAKKTSPKPIPVTTRRASIGEDAPKRKTASDVIAEQKRARGQTY